MAWPVPREFAISTEYGKRGKSWRCSANAAGAGVHTGADFAAPAGTPLFATLAGTIRHRNYGSAFGRHQFVISPSKGQPYAAGEVFYAHGSKRLPDGTEVQPGDWVGEVGFEGNVSPAGPAGAHLHYELHPSTKGVWSCAVHADPSPTLSRDAHHVTADIYSSKLGYGEPSNGDAFSDSIKELQECLNRISLVGGRTLEVTGRYDDATDAEVRKWQRLIGAVPDQPKQSFLGPKQLARMFPAGTYTVHDTGLPPIATGAPTDPLIPELPTDTGSTELGGLLGERGWTVHDTDVPLGRESLWLGPKFLIVHHTGSKGKVEDVVSWLRTECPDPPGIQVLLSRAGEVWICSQERPGQPSPGRASHAGRGSGYGVPDDQMNPVSVGLEVEADGTEPLRSDPELYRLVLELLDDLADIFDIDTENVLGHKEWSSTNKPDPLDDMDVMRADLAAVRGEAEPPPPPTGEVLAEITDANGRKQRVLWKVAPA